MCYWLNIPRSSYSYKVIETISELELEEKVKKVSLENKVKYGARKIKATL